MATDVVWHEGLAADDALRIHVSSLVAVPAGEVWVGRHCPACGSDRHGRPWARAAERPVHVSLSRAGEHVVTAVADHPVGIDAEPIAAVAARWDPTLVLHPSEPDGTPGVLDIDEERAAVWCRKEAILKALGTGLDSSMTTIRCADWAVEDVPAPPGLAASTAVIPQRGSGGSSTA